MLLRVAETSGGNPLYALELARALDRLEIRPVPGRPLPLPAGLQALVDDRIRSLSHDVRLIAAGTAAAWRFTDAGLNPDDLAEAVRLGIVIVDDAGIPTDPWIGGTRVVRAAHPLLGSAAYADLSTVDRRALHRRLAEQSDDPVEQARHAALASAGPQPEVAAALDRGVRSAIAAGTPGLAVELGRLAVAHSTTDADRLPRLDRLVDALFRAGDTAGALQVQRSAVALAQAGPSRALRRVRLAELLIESASATSMAEFAAAVEEAEGDPMVQADALLTYASMVDDIDRRVELAERAVALLDQPGHEHDPQVTDALGAAIAQAAGARFRAGHGLDHRAFARAITLESRSSRRLSDRADASYAALLKYADDLNEAQRRLYLLLAEARESGDLSSVVYILSHLPQLYVWRGDLARAGEYAAEALAICEQSGLERQAGQARYNVAYTLAHQGCLDEAEPVVQELLAAARGEGSWEWQRAYGLLGFIAVSRGDLVLAAARLDQWDATLRRMQFGEPGYSRSHLDYVTALIGTGRVDDVRTFLARLDEQVHRTGRASAASIARTGHALVAATEGALDVAVAGIDAAVASYDGSPLRFDRARTLLISGQIHRRAKAKTAAARALREAHAEFTTFGAATWAAEAETELARVSLRPSAPTDLTETERRVAELAATGLTNREIADRLFLAVKTVEANLARVYRKLRVRSRAELGSRIQRP